MISADYGIENYRYPRSMPYLKNSGPGFFVVEAKVHSSFLMDHMPQAVADMITCAKSLTYATFNHPSFVSSLMICIDGPIFAGH